jgi:predicted transcriptional regulator
MKKRKTRCDCVLNKVKILSALNKILKIKGRKPTSAEIAQECGLGIRTVKRHLSEYNHSGGLKDFKILTGKVIISLYEKAQEGRAPEVKLWMDLIENNNDGQENETDNRIEKIQFLLEEPDTSDKENRT